MEAEENCPEPIASDLKATTLLRKHEIIRQKILSIHKYQLQSMHPSDQGPWGHVYLSMAHTFYKVVAAVGDRFLSVYDGSTPYCLGRWTCAKQGGASCPPLSACLYAFSNADEAANATFPSWSRLKRFPKVVIEVRAEGHSFMNKDVQGMWALSKVRMVSIVTALTAVRTLDICRNQERTKDAPVNSAGQTLSAKEADASIYSMERPRRSAPMTAEELRSTSTRVLQHQIENSSRRDMKFWPHSLRSIASSLTVEAPVMPLKPSFRPPGGGATGSSRGQLHDRVHVGTWSHAPRSQQAVIQEAVQGMGAAHAGRGVLLDVAAQGINSSATAITSLR
ncbi:hypothetical protein CEUSTIGMA_g5478.t1 [Chlamydomonas eustigma]|uniref:Uncharacterized protein n=1 Tax=Chlamydomonas eustigma TaxID=1157962 RepID=A0A250X4Q4_9CHLO|nr:hypothetical protein CEUSTIGMA_g5478.t1 [Chlamydomonas eustigma]|eukprot:GAX78036.1 hypothetical protein CEUSTIGMA_g5478.t1 [Chlamydomonas eustigma]